jgi:hypothetical protein
MLYIRYKYIVVLILLKLYENTKTGRFTSFVYICNAIENPVILKRDFGIPLTCLTAWTGSHARETLISRTHLFLPHDIPPTKTSSTIKS